MSKMINKRKKIKINTLNMPKYFKALNIILKASNDKKGKFKTLFSRVSDFATILAMGFLIWSITQSYKQISLQQVNIDQIDSTLSIMREQLILQQESNGIMSDYIFKFKDNTDMEKIRFIEENRPNIDLEKVDCEIKGNEEIIYINYLNIGKSGATDVNMTVIGIDSKGENIINANSGKYKVVNRYKRKIDKLKLERKEGIIFLKIQFHWKWQILNRPDSSTFYKALTYDEIENKCKCRTISSDRFKLFN